MEKRCAIPWELESGEFDKSEVPDASRRLVDPSGANSSAICTYDAVPQLDTRATRKKVLMTVTTALMTTLKIVLRVKLLGTERQ